MEGLTLSAKEQNRLQVLNGVLEQRWSMREAAPLLGVSERQGWRLLAAYRKEGARGLAHKNRGRIPPNATPKNIQQQVVALAVDRYERINHTHLSELLAEREGLMLSRPTVRRILVRAGLSSPRFGVSAAQPESAYRPVDQGLDLGSVLCIKELRRVAKDNTVQYHGRSLQLRGNKSTGTW